MGDSGHLKWPVQIVRAAGGRGDQILSPLRFHTCWMAAEAGGARSPLSQARAQGCSAHTGKHTHSSKLSQDTDTASHPQPRTSSCRRSLSHKHTLTHAVAAGREKWPLCVGILPALSYAPIAPGEIVPNEASALVGEIKNLPSWLLSR